MHMFVDSVASEVRSLGYYRPNILENDLNYLLVVFPKNRPLVHHWQIERQ